MYPGFNPYSRSDLPVSHQQWNVEAAGFNAEQRDLKDRFREVSFTEHCEVVKPERPQEKTIWNTPYTDPQYQRIRDQHYHQRREAYFKAHE